MSKKMNHTKLIGIAALSLSLLLPSLSTSSEIYILHMKKGRDMKCLSVKRIGSNLLCDADGLEITVDTSTVEKMSKANGQLSKWSPRTRTVAGTSSGRSIFSQNGYDENIKSMVRQERQNLEKKKRDEYRRTDAKNRSAKFRQRIYDKYEEKFKLLEENPVAYFSPKPQREQDRENRKNKVIYDSSDNEEPILSYDDGENDAWLGLPQKSYSGSYNEGYQDEEDRESR